MQMKEFGPRRGRLWRSLDPPMTHNIGSHITCWATHQIGLSAKWSLCIILTTHQIHQILTQQVFSKLFKDTLEKC